MKIVATVTDCAARINADGGVESRSAVIDLGDDLPSVLQTYLKNRKWASQGPNRFTYESLSFSILDEEEEDKP